MKAWILATAALAMAPAATFAHGFHLSIGLGGIRINSGGGYSHCDAYGPAVYAAPVYVEPAVTYCAPPPVVYQAPVVYQPPVVYAAPPVYVSPPVVYAAPRTYVYPAAPAGYFYYGR